MTIYTEKIDEIIKELECEISTLQAKIIVYEKILSDLRDLKALE